MDVQDVCDGLMPKHFLKGLQQHPLEYGQNGKCVACKIRDDLDPAVAFPAYDSKAEPHGIVFTYRKDTFGESFFSSVPLYFSISSIAMGNNFTTYATPVFIRLPISHVPPWSRYGYYRMLWLSGPHRKDR